jgi:hypothetical protein
MYFDPRPKARKEDLYDREEELELLRRSVGSNPLTVVTGVRRLGKTSLLLVGLRDIPHVILDTRGVNPNSRRDLVKRFESGINTFLRDNSRLRDSILRRLENIAGVQVMGSGVTLRWKRGRADLLSIAGVLEEQGAVLAVDEVQNLRGVVGREFAELLAHIYDYTDLRVVLTGSQVGLLYDFLGVDDPSSPLYGRHFSEIKLRRFSKGESLDFLRKGFAQLGMHADEDVLEQVVDRLDGIVGWLVLFGLRCSEAGKVSGEMAEDVMREAGKLAIQELKNFIKRHAPAEKRFLLTAKAVASGKRVWSDIKDYVEEAEGRSIPSSVLARILNSLVKASFLRKRVDGRNVWYEMEDPVLENALTLGQKVIGNSREEAHHGGFLP